MAISPTTCPHCGAEYRGERTCESVFNEFLALEFSGEGYGSVHFLTVACYMIQHGQYSDEALVWIEQRLRETLEKGVPVEDMRRQAGRETGQRQRDWKITRQPGDPPQAIIPWSMTIQDVAARFVDAESYRYWITQWAQATLAEMQPLILPRM